MHIKEVKTSALTQTIKFETNTNEVITTVTISGQTLIKLGKTQHVLLYSSVHSSTAHIAVQLQHNDRFSNCVLLLFLYLLYKLYCSGRLEEVHRGNGCSYRIGTEMVLQWHCLVCSIAIDCCSTVPVVTLSGV
jgi:hypothetical protein